MIYLYRFFFQPISISQFREKKIWINERFTFIRVHVLPIETKT